MIKDPSNSRVVETRCVSFIWDEFARCRMTGRMETGVERA